MNEGNGVLIKWTRLGEILGPRGPAGGGRRPGSGRRRARSSLKKGAIGRLVIAPSDGSAVVARDEMGPEAAKSLPGTEVIPPGTSGRGAPGCG